MVNRGGFFKPEREGNLYINCVQAIYYKNIYNKSYQLLTKPIFSYQRISMNYLIVSDIYGLTPALSKLSQAISSNLVIVDPYNNKIQAIESEQDSYNNFIQQCGHDKYTDKLLECFESLKVPTTCIAFSAGASAAWRAQLLTGNTHLKRLIGFYPSQIRNYLALDANVPCEFIFPESESHFNVDEVIKALSTKAGVKCYKTNFLHGFMNEYSTNFNAQGLVEYSSYIKQSSR